MGEGLVSRAGLVVVDQMAQETGLTEGFGSVFGQWSGRRPGPGYAQVAIGLADGATCLSDVTGPARNGLFSDALSNATLWDWFNRITTTDLAGVRQARDRPRGVIPTDWR